MPRPPATYLRQAARQCHPARPYAHARARERFKRGSGRIRHRAWRARGERL